ncbi:MAG: hypothetical protein NWF05_01760 [Candidatus Bathyarchaeota archaeon]|nr:hypothetical protein [Candidatus Bathyarchaeota archaeon]
MMKHNHPHILAAGMLLAIFLTSTYVTCHADSTFAPTWFKEGIYAEYTFENLNIFVVDGSIKAQNAIFRWECTNYNNTTAKLNITLNGTQTERFYGDSSATVTKITPLLLSAQLYVDPASRAVYCVNGTHIGTTHLWLPANPTDGENITIWNMPQDKITQPATIIGHTATPQGPQKSFRVGLLYHDLDTGLMTLTSGITGITDRKEPTVDALEVYTITGNGKFAATNIDLGPSDEPFNWQGVLQLIALPVAAVLILIGVYWRRKRYKRQ